MQLHIGDRYSDETGEWEVVSRPVSFRGGKSVWARVQVPGKPETEREDSRAFLSAVERAQAALKDAGKDASRLEGYTWHGNRHTFASRLVMAGVDLLTVQTLGGWRTPSMVQRYAHLAPEHMARAVERLVNPAVELGRDLNALPASEVASSATVA